MTTKPPVIFIDDEKYIRIAGKQTLEQAGYDPLCFDSAEKALTHLTPEWPGVVVSDVMMPRMDGLSFMKQALSVDRDLPIILITRYGDIPMAVQAIRDGAYDFIEKPISNEILVEVVKRALGKRTLTLENRSLRRELEAHSSPGPRIIGQSPAVQRLRKMINQVADAPADVLLLGETGTGKELVARCLHNYSRRRDKNFVAINCGAVPENLIESELFGTVAGAYTGATDRKGLFEEADGGTLLLDEIESMPMPLQVKLLRVLEERCIRRLGSNEDIALDLRIVAATKVDLKESSQEGAFREDLYFRLNVLTIELPSVQQRMEDIPLLFQHFVLEACDRLQVEMSPTTEGISNALMAYSWPGNVRELRNAAERYVLLGEDGLNLDELSGGEKTDDRLKLPDLVSRFEKTIVEQALAQHKGNMTESSTELGIPRDTLKDKMRKYGLRSRDFR